MYLLDCIIELRLVVRCDCSVDLELVAQSQAQLLELRFSERLHVNLRGAQFVLIKDREEVLQLELRQPLK